MTQDLNVVSCVRQLMEGNLKVCEEVSESLIRKLIFANVKFGRRARWLNILEVFLECQGKPIQKNQELILRLLLDDKDILVDFTCDYQEGSKNLKIAQSLGRGDERRGKSRQELMIDKDHELNIRSLLKYHMTGLRLLGMCAAGKLNQSAKDECTQIPEITLQKCIEGFLDLDLKPDGSREERIDFDVIFYVQRPYLRLITNVYITNFDPKSFKSSVERWWPRDLAFGAHERDRDDVTRARLPDLGIRQSVMGECVRILENLRRRLRDISPEREDFASACFKSPDDRFPDSIGSDLSLHIGISLQIFETLAAFFCREDAFTRHSNAGHDVLVLHLTSLMPQLCEEFNRFHCEPHVKALVELKYALERHQFSGIYLTLEKEEEAHVEDTSERAFGDGWENFIAHLAIQLKVDPNPDKSMLRSVRDLALVFGSKKTFGNRNLEHIKMLIDTASDMSLEPINQLTAIRIIIASLYMQPSNRHMTSDARDKEFRRFLDGEDPSAGTPVSQGGFSDLQTAYAKLGVVQVVINCARSEDRLQALEAVRLGVILLTKGGHRPIQHEFEIQFSSPSSQSFLEALREMFHRAATHLQASRNNTGSGDARASLTLSLEVQQVFQGNSTI